MHAHGRLSSREQGNDEVAIEIHLAQLAPRGELVAQPIVLAYLYLVDPTNSLGHGRLPKVLLRQDSTVACVNKCALVAVLT